MNNVCVCCLSADRKLSPLGEYWPLFNALMKVEDLSSSISTLNVCWECKAHLRRFSSFQQTTLRCLNTLKQYCRLIQTGEQPLMSQCETRLSIHVLDNMECVVAKDNLKVEVKPEYTEIEVTPDIYDSSSENCDSAKADVAVTIKSEEEEEEENSEDGNGNSAKSRKKSKKQTSNTEMQKAERWSCELVSEAQMQEWRKEDADSGRYQGLFYKCTTCIISFKNEDQLEQHNSKHHHESLGPYVCDVCQTRFEDEPNLLEHRDAHRKIYKCLVCDFTNRQLVVFKRHYRIEHSEPDKKCNLCDAMFKTKSQLKSHKDMHGGKITCKYCEKSFETRSKLQTHMTEHRNLPAVQCFVCDKTLKNHYILNAHLRRHDQTNSSLYCHVCKVQYKNQLTYNQHFGTSMKHLKPDQIKHECSECGKRFATESSRRRHILVHLKTKAEGEIVCELCSKYFSSQRALSLHVTHKHKQTTERAARDIVCDVCGKGFTVQCFHFKVVMRCLKIHQNIHSGAKPYECEHCDAKFRQPATLHTHQRLVHKALRRKI